jgi:hypothetical protein
MNIYTYIHKYLAKRSVQIPNGSVRILNFAGRLHQRRKSSLPARKALDVKTDAAICVCTCIYIYVYEYPHTYIYMMTGMSAPTCIPLFISMSRPAGPGVEFQCVGSDVHACPHMCYWLSAASQIKSNACLSQVSPEIKELFGSDSDDDHRKALTLITEFDGHSKKKQEQYYKIRTPMRRCTIINGEADPDSKFEKDLQRALDEVIFDEDDTTLANLLPTSSSSSSRLPDSMPAPSNGTQPRRKLQRVGRARQPAEEEPPKRTKVPISENGKQWLVKRSLEFSLGFPQTPPVEEFRTTFLKEGIKLKHLVENQNPEGMRSHVRNEFKILEKKMFAKAEKDRRNKSKDAD